MKLLVLDIEGTLFRTTVQLPRTSISSTIWQAIAQALGPECAAEEIASHRKWESGKYHTYLQWVKDTIAIHRKYHLSHELFRQIIASAEYNPGVKETISQLDRNRYEPVLISGGFRELAARAQQDLRIYHAFAACEYFFGEDGALQSYNLLPCDFEGKIDFIKLMLREYGLGDEDWIFVGDGANDIPIAKVAPVSIGFCPHPELEKVITHSITDFGNLVRVLDYL